MSVDEAFRRILARDEGISRPLARPQAPQSASAAEEASGLDVRRVEQVEEFAYPSIDAQAEIEAQYRQLRMRLQSLHLPRRSVLLTSCHRGEGKTTTAVYTALAMARRREERVALIDLNLRRPGLAAFLGLSCRSGIVELLDGEQDLASALVYSREDDLYVLPAERAVRNPTELLESTRLRLLLSTLHEDFDFLVIDGSPCCTVADPLLFGSLCGGTVLVTRAHQTQRQEIYDALRVLQENEMTPVGMVLTFAQPVVPHLYDGH